MQGFQQYIDGTFEEGAARFDSIDPATGTVWAAMPEAREDDVDRAVKAAQHALWSGEWPAMTATARGKLLYRLADLVQSNARKLAELETRDTGKIIRETSAQIAYVADYYRYYAGLADKIEGATLPIDAHVPGLRELLRVHRAAALVATPGAGKTTRVPPALAADGAVLVLQPRRAAARAAACRSRRR